MPMTLGVPGPVQQLIQGHRIFAAGIVRMDADRAEQGVVGFGHGPNGIKLADPRTDAQHMRDAGDRRPFQDPW